MAEPRLDIRDKRATWLAGLLAQRSVQITLAAWVLANLAVLLIPHGQLPFHKPGPHHAPFTTQLLTPNAVLVETLGLTPITFALTRRRERPDIAARAPQP